MHHQNFQNTACGRALIPGQQKYCDSTDDPLKGISAGPVIYGAIVTMARFVTQQLQLQGIHYALLKATLTEEPAWFKCGFLESNQKTRGGDSKKNYLLLKVHAHEPTQLLCLLCYWKLDIKVGLNEERACAGYKRKEYLTTLL
jgi:hypothetical protein